MGRKKRINCKSCNEPIEPELRVYCRACKKKVNRFALIRNIDVVDYQPVIEFVDRINARGGLCSLHELFVEMITLHNEYCIWNEYKNWPANQQLNKMWSDLNIISELKKEKKFGDLK